MNFLGDFTVKKGFFRSENDISIFYLISLYCQIDFVYLSRLPAITLLALVLSLMALRVQGACVTNGCNSGTNIDCAELSLTAVPCLNSAATKVFVIHFLYFIPFFLAPVSNMIFVYCSFFLATFLSALKIISGWLFDFPPSMNNLKRYLR